MAARAAALFSFSLFFFFCSHATLVSPGAAGSSKATADELVLLSFKSSMSGQSSLLLASWNTSSHYCSWPGVACGRQHPDRVVSLLMESSNLSGRISPFLGKLSFLRELDLGNNQLVGQIPSELGRLVRLQTLNLSNNQLQGEIPAEIGSTMKSLVYLNLGKNALSGAIPPSLADLPSLEHLTLFYNRLSGNIPSSLGNLTNLTILHLDFNMLSGAIPSSLGMLSRLSRLTLGNNSLSGPIPDSFWNISSLVSYSVQGNMLNGVIPPDAFSNLPRLQSIFMDHNYFHGPIPKSIVNASDLQMVQLGHNPFSGIVPPDIGRLTQLGWLVLLETSLEAKQPDDWEFITSLTNCSQLQFLELGVSKFRGVLPDSVSNLSTSLIQLNLNDNAISGSIPKDISNLVNLQYLDLSMNSFTGSIPSSLGRLKNLNLLYLFSNNMSGSVPLTIGNLTQLSYINLGMNAFSGRIPSTIGNLETILEIDLSDNNFTGPIPSGLFNITPISLDISDNNLQGSIPHEIGNLKGLIEFNAGLNKLSGEIPSSLGECQHLQNLYLYNNMLSGSIPLPLSQVKGLENLDLSSNNLSGQIPDFFGNLGTLYSLNLSFNNFVGQVPTFGVFANATATSIQGNGKLCGGVPDLNLPPCSFQSPKRKHKLIVIPIVLSLIATIVIFSLLYKLIRTCHKKIKTKIPLTSMQGYPMISYSQLVKATDGFSTTKLLGSGSFGSVYKGEFDCEAGQIANLVAAVKVLKPQTPKALKSFIAECEALRNMRHRNLLKILTVCSSIDARGDDFKAIVYEFMPNGSLEGWLHPDTNEQLAEHNHLDLLGRVTVLLDVAYALDYLHCHGPTPVVHCDLKPSNVLLDGDMTAHVGDFGLAKILVETNSSLFQQSTSSMGFRGTIGYAPSEYGAGNMVSTHGDIYSYGILVLETVTGKRPTDREFVEGLSLREYVELGLRGSRVMDVVDTRLSLGLDNELFSDAPGSVSSLDNELKSTTDDFSFKRKIECLISIVRLGLSCSQEVPSSRTPTGDIIKELHAIKASLLL